MIKFPGNDNRTPVTFPAVMSKSRDYNLIENLFTTVFNYFYTLSSEIHNCHNPKRCSSNLLPLLAQYYRYQYTNVENIDLEREIIAYVPLLHHNKGCNVGIDNALALCKVNKTEDITIPWFYDKENNEVVVIVFNNLKTYKMLDLLYLVVPLGTKIVFRSGNYVKSNEEVQYHSWTQVNVGDLDKNKQYCVQPNNYWHTKWNPEEELYHIYVDAQWALGDPTNKEPQSNYINPITKENITDDGATRVSGIEVASNKVVDKNE